MGENGKGFQTCLVQASDLSHHQYEKKVVFPQEYVQFFEKLHTINHFYSN